jgi:hypothetical protein
MRLRELLTWQMQGYALYHASRANLALHMVVVPVFWLGTSAFVWGLLAVSLWWTVAGAGLMAFSMALQGRGHALENVATMPFTGWKNALTRIFLEQWITFPHFVTSGGWLRAWRSAK